MSIGSYPWSKVPTCRTKIRRTRNNPLHSLHLRAVLNHKKVYDIEWKAGLLFIFGKCLRTLLCSGFVITIAAAAPLFPSQFDNTCRDFCLQFAAVGSVSPSCILEWNKPNTLVYLSSSLQYTFVLGYRFSRKNLKRNRTGAISRKIRQSFCLLFCQV